MLRDRPKNERYDLMLGDAFADIAIPYHLVTPRVQRDRQETI